jgi:diaminopimelate decarboxylase
MSAFHLRGGEMHAEAVSLETIAAAVGTPAYVYSADALPRSAQRFRAALGKIPRKQLMFAVKANPSLAVLRVLADQNYGADIVSGGELSCALRAGITGNHIVYSGAGKAAHEGTQGGACIANTRLGL